MALLDISQVTRSVITLIEQAFDVSPEWTQAIPSVLPEPPNRMTTEGLGFYLYHIQENNQFKNFPPPGRDEPAVRYVPMALNLYYQLSANSILEDGTGAFNEQLMMGIAIKALHDFSEINDTTRVNSVMVMDPALRGKENRFKISMQSVPYNEAIQFWTAGSSPVKLSAYYELSIVFLEPEEPQSYAGRVLRYGTFIFTEGAPQITASQNVISYTLPGGSAQEIKAQPALASPGNTFHLVGANFSGNRIELLLINARWTGRAVAGATWNVRLIATNRIEITAQETATLQNGGTSVAILPGLYGVQVNVVRSRTMPDGTIREFANISNQFPVTITPGITGFVVAGTLVTVTGFVFQHPDLPEDEVVVFLGENRLARDVALSAGTFHTPAANTLQIRLPAGLVSGLTLPVRILVNGAESPPRWITTP